jgi:hypothetical protein
MSLFCVDVEADGPIPGVGDFSMLSFSAIRVDNSLEIFFKSGAIKTISPFHDARAIEAIGLSEQDYVANYALLGKDPLIIMERFEKWIMVNNTNGRPIFISDNNGFDWMFICWYFQHFLKRNPFGYSSRRIGDLYCGLVKDMRAKWKHLRQTPHTHNPADDAKGNAEAILYMINKMGLKG